MTTIQDIQTELITAYEATTLPHSLGTPTGYKHEPENGFASADLPAVVVTRGILVSNTPLADDRRLIVREYITDLYLYTVSDSDPINATERDNTANCIDTIETAFSLHGLNTSHVIAHEITGETADVELFARDDTQNYIGARFRHEITYYQT